MVRSPIHTRRRSPLAQELPRSIAQADHGEFAADALAS
jgi:hypothetical protein